MLKIKKIKIFVVIIIVLITWINVFLMWKKYLNSYNQLNKYLKLSFIDPILSIPEQYYQLDWLRLSVQNLEKVQNEARKLYDLNITYPINFLKNYIELIQKQYIFFKEPNIKNAFLYQEFSEKTIQSYIDDIIDLKQIINKEFPIDNNIYLSDRTYTDLDITQKDLDILLENWQELKKIIENRRKCLIWNKSFCEFDINSQISFYENKNDVKYENTSQYTQVMLRNGCNWEDEDKSYFFYIDCPNYISFCIWEIDFTNKKFYKKLNPGSKITYEYFLLEKWIKFVKANVNVPYACQNNWHIGVMWNTDYFLNYIKNNILQQSSWNTKKLEEKIILNNWWKIEDFEKLQKLYIDYINKNINDIDLENEIVVRYRLLKSQLMNLDLVINRDIFFNVNHLTFRTFMKSEYKTEDDYNNMLKIYWNSFFINRLNYSIYFLTYSPIFWKIEKRPIFYKKAEDTLLEKDLLNMTYEDLHLFYTQEEIDNNLNLLEKRKWKAKFYSPYHYLIWFGQNPEDIKH